MKKIKFPSAQTVLLLIAGFVALLTWLIPSGQFDRLAYNKKDVTFIKTSQEKSISLKANQKTLDDLGVKIPLDKFTSGAINKPISIPGTYKQLEARPQGFKEFVLAPLKGIIAVADIIILVLFIGGLVAIVNFTGAFEAGISRLSLVLKGKEFILIIAVTSLIALGGTTFGLEEETIAEPDIKSDTEPDAEPEAEPIIEPVTKSDTEPDAKPSYEELKKIAAELGFVKKGMPSKVELIEFIESKNQA